VSVEGGKIKIHGGFLDSIGSCGKVKVEEKDGVVNLSINTAVSSFLNKNEIDIEKTFDNTIDTIYVGKYVIYDHRVVIDKKVSMLYAQKTPYIGDVSEVLDVIGASGVSEVFDIGNKSLQTTNEPYGLIIDINCNIDEDNEGVLNSYMDEFSTIYIGCIENLGEVTWRYKVNGEKKSHKTTSEYASTLVGEHIKDISVNASKLQETMERFELLDLSKKSKSVKSMGESI
jgi:hypothetical protein